ncbi:unnamed protein product [Effrenium voratum]|nr:unnamed protein product [Effrenium voratum]
MAGCPIAGAFMQFAKERSLGSVGHLNVTHCPDHSLRPAVVLRLCEQLDAFRVDASESLALVALTPERAASLSHLASPGNPEPTAEDIQDAAEPANAQAYRGTVLSFGGAKSKTSLAGTSEPQAPQALGFETAAIGKGRSTLRIAQEVQKESSGDAPKMVRRSIDWSDARFLERLVRRGLKARDEGWKASWEETCLAREIPSSFAVQKPAKEVLVEFVEANLCQTTGKDWAKPLLYKAEGEERIRS